MVQHFQILEESSIILWKNEDSSKFRKNLPLLFVPELACMHRYLFEIKFSGLHTIIQVCTLIFLAIKIVSARLFRSAQMKILQNAFIKLQFLVCTLVVVQT